MIKVKGVYNGTTVELLEPVSIPVDTKVEVLIDAEHLRYLSQEEQEAHFLLHLREKGLVSDISPQEVNLEPYTRIQVEGKPISETIIEERR